MIVKRTDLNEIIEDDIMHFRKRTMLTRDIRGIVISTVGKFKLPDYAKLFLLSPDNAYHRIGANRYYETMAWYVEKGLQPDVPNIGQTQIDFDSPWAIDHINDESDKEAEVMHEIVVAEITEKLESGKI